MVHISNPKLISSELESSINRCSTEHQLYASIEELSVACGTGMGALQDRGRGQTGGLCDGVSGTGKLDVNIDLKDVLL